jgi:hypothetical protein
MTEEALQAWVEFVAEDLSVPTHSVHRRRLPSRPREQSENVALRSPLSGKRLDAQFEFRVVGEIETRTRRRMSRQNGDTSGEQASLPRLLARSTGPDAGASLLKSLIEMRKLIAFDRHHAIWRVPLEFAKRGGPAAQVSQSLLNAYYTMVQYL